MNDRLQTAPGSLSRMLIRRIAGRIQRPARLRLLILAVLIPLALGVGDLVGYGRAAVGFGLLYVLVLRPERSA